MDGKHLEDIIAKNGLHRGCTMASTMFKLYACVMAEQWSDRFRDVDGVGT